jgi:hypothetical protein
VIARFPDKLNVEFTEDASLKTPAAFHHIHIATPDPEKARAWRERLVADKPGDRR